MSESTSLRARLGLDPALLGPFVLALGWASVLLRSSSLVRWSDPFVAVPVAAALAALVASIAAASRADERLQRATGAALLSGLVGVLMLRLGGVEFPMQDLAHPWMVWAVLLAVCTALFGVLLHRPWGRWLAIGLGCAAAGSTLIHLIERWSAPGDHVVRLASVCALSGLLVWSFAGSRAARTDRHIPSDPWSTQGVTVAWLRAAMIATFVAVPMLVVFAWLEGGRSEALTTPAVALAATLCLGAWLVARGKVAGGVLLAMGGLGVLGFIAVNTGRCSTSYDVGITTYYAMFWIPAGIATLGSGGLLIRDGWRALQRTD